MAKPPTPVHGGADRRTRAQPAHIGRPGSGQHAASGAAKDRHDGRDLLDATDDVRLAASLLNVVFGEEEFFLFVACELSAIGKKPNKDSSKTRPDDEQGWYSSERGVE